MITTLVLTGEHKVGMNSARKIKITTESEGAIKDVIISVDKEVPIVRYRFGEYTEASINYIVNMMEQFKNSTHLIEVNIGASMVPTFELLKAKGIYDKIAKFVYADVTDAEVESRALPADVVSYIPALSEYTVDRILIKDKSNTLDAVVARIITKSIKAVLGNKYADNKFGICSSPLSFDETACLSAVVARDIMSTYNAPKEMAIPSANHQCMNCCGCIRYYKVEHDMEAPSENQTKTRAKKEGSTDKENKPAKAPKVKNKITFGQFSL